MGYLTKKEGTGQSISDATDALLKVLNFIVLRSLGITTRKFWALDGPSPRAYEALESLTGIPYPERHLQELE